MGSYAHGRRVADLAHCPDLTGSPTSRAYQGDLDALQVAHDIRELDPREIWGRLNKWGHEDPQRLLAAAVSLAAMVNPDQHAIGVSPQWAQGIGGTAALHPDFATAPADVRRGLPLERDSEILRLARDGGLSDHEIALRVGVSGSTVQRVRAAAGLTGQPGGATAELDVKVAELQGLGWRPDAIARELEISTRTVDRARVRIAAAEQVA